MTLGHTPSVERTGGRVSPTTTSTAGVSFHLLEIDTRFACFAPSLLPSTGSGRRTDSPRCPSVITPRKECLSLRTSSVCSVQTLPLGFGRGGLSHSLDNPAGEGASPLPAASKSSDVVLLHAQQHGDSTWKSCSQNARKFSEHRREKFGVASPEKFGVTR